MMITRQEVLILREALDSGDTAKVASAIRKVLRQIDLREEQRT